MRPNERPDTIKKPDLGKSKPEDRSISDTNTYQKHRHQKHRRWFDTASHYDPHLPSNKICPTRMERLLCNTRTAHAFIETLLRKIPIHDEIDPELANPEKQAGISRRKKEIVAYCTQILSSILTHPPSLIAKKTHLAQENSQQIILGTDMSNLPAALHSDTNQPRVPDSWYHTIKHSIKNLYLLVSPCTNPNEYPAIKKAEEETGLQHIQKNNPNNTVWLPEIWGPDRLTYKSVAELSPREKQVIDMWWEWKDGLLDHTFLAAEFIRGLVLDIQDHIINAIPVESRNLAQHQILQLDPNVLGVKLLFHDFGRTVTHDRQQHEKVTQELLSEAHIHEDWRTEPTIIEYFIAEILPPVHALAEEDISSILYHLSDVAAKGGIALQRPSSILQKILERKNHYAKQGQIDRNSKIAYYGDYETQNMLQLLYYLESEEGLQYPRVKLDTVYTAVETWMWKMREELGLREPTSEKIAR